MPLLDGNSSGGEPSVVEKYAGMRGSDWGWPEGVLPISHWGCGMYACVDCRGESAQVLLFEPNGGDPDHVWFLDSPSLADWLTTWLDGTGWYEEDNDDLDLPPVSYTAPNRSPQPSHSAVTSFRTTAHKSSPREKGRVTAWASSAGSFWGCW